MAPTAKWGPSRLAACKHRPRNVHRVSLAAPLRDSRNAPERLPAPRRCCSRLSAHVSSARPQLRQPRLQAEERVAGGCPRGGERVHGARELGTPQRLALAHAFPGLASPCMPSRGHAGRGGLATRETMHPTFRVPPFCVVQLFTSGTFRTIDVKDTKKALTSIQKDLMAAIHAGEGGDRTEVGGRSERRGGGVEEQASPPKTIVAFSRLRGLRQAKAGDSSKTSTLVAEFIK
eukprot:3178729-Prymnesium_polylepis.1